MFALFHLVVPVASLAMPCRILNASRGHDPPLFPPIIHQAPVSFTALRVTKTSFPQPPVRCRLVPGATGEIATDRTRVASAVDGAISTSGLTNWRCRTLQSGPVDTQRLVTVKLDCRLYLLINRLVGNGGTVLPRISSSLSSVHHRVHETSKRDMLL